jgi:hypothetical protein
MVRYYFHLRAGEEYIPDVTGADIEDTRACARHLMRMLDKAASRDHGGWIFEITDDTGVFRDEMAVEDLLGAVH